jgi:hypothetical protein
LRKSSAEKHVKTYLVNKPSAEEKNMQTSFTQPAGLKSEICSEENIAFLMLSEVLRARSQDILDNLKNEQIDIARLRRLALHMRLSADDLIRGSGLLKRTNNSKSSSSLDSGTEPASLQAVFDLCLIAAKNRLDEMNIALESDEAPSDLFVSGNPWEIAYAFFAILQKAGKAQRRFDLEGVSPAAGTNPISTLKVAIEIADGFVDVCIPSDTPIDPNFVDSTFGSDSATNMSSQEWYCFRRLLENNNAHIHVQVCEKGRGTRYCVILRLPTFQPGYEEPIDFLKASSGFVDSSQEN